MEENIEQEKRIYTNSWKKKKVEATAQSPSNASSSQRSAAEPQKSGEVNPNSVSMVQHDFKILG